MRSASSARASTTAPLLRRERGASADTSSSVAVDSRMLKGSDLRAMSHSCYKSFNVAVSLS